MNGRPEKKESFLRHPLFTAIVGALVGALAGALFSATVMVDHYIPIDDINSYIELSLVKTGYVDTSVLDLATYGEKMDAVKDSFKAYSSSIDDALQNLGMSADDISELSETQRLIKLTDISSTVYADYVQAEIDLNSALENIDSLESSIQSAETEIEDLNESIVSQVSISLLAAALVIDGEIMNEGETIPKAIAQVNGNYYYSSGLLSSYLLSDTLQFNVENNMIIYGVESPEKTRLSWSIVTDPDGIEYRALEDDAICMGTVSYDEGIVLKRNGYCYIHLGGEYSKISFVCGHIDESAQDDAMLTFYKISDDNLSYEKIGEITLTGEMLPKEFEINLNYTDAIKIVMSDIGSRTQYGMTDIYLYS